MAISFSQPSPIPGVTVTYNVIIATTYIPDNTGATAGNTFVQLGAYVDSAAAAVDTGFQNAINGQAFTFSGQLTAAEAESAIIALPAWAGATIVS
jgi:hypothetical protein